MEIPEPPFGGLPTGVPGGAGGIGGAGGGAGGAARSFFNTNSAITQILMWQVVGQILAPILAPVGQAIANTVWPNAPVVELSPADAALAVLRGNMTQADAEETAKASGVRPDRFGVIINNTGEPISIEQALFLWRRGKISEGDLEKAVRESRVRNEWLQAVKDLGIVPLSVSDAVDAVVENQISHDQGQQIAYFSGVTAEDFQILVDTRGRPPGEAQLLELVRRGIIPEGGTGPGVLSLEQGISESAIKDKWIPAYRALLTYLPPPRTITALERAGTISAEQAQHLYQEAGLSPELAAAYSADASRQKTQKHRDLTEAQVLSMYQAHYLDQATASGLLAALGYDDHEVGMLLAWEDVQRELKAVQTALSHLHALYTSRKIGTTTLTNSFNALGVSSTQQDELLRIWTLERNARVATLTAAQIATAFQHQIIDQAAAVAALQDLGYSAFDAWLYLSQHLHTALPDQPAPDSVTGQLQ